MLTHQSSAHVASLSAAICILYVAVVAYSSSAYRAAFGDFCQQIINKDEEE